MELIPIKKYESRHETYERIIAYVSVIFGLIFFVCSCIILPCKLIELLFTIRCNYYEFIILFQMNIILYIIFIFTMFYLLLINRQYLNILKNIKVHICDIETLNNIEYLLTTIDFDRANSINDVLIYQLTQPYLRYKCHKEVMKNIYPLFQKN